MTPLKSGNLKEAYVFRLGFLDGKEGLIFQLSKGMLVPLSAC
jgi:hypothetical protein